MVLRTQAGQLACSPSQSAMLRIAASLAEGIPVDLRDMLTTPTATTQACQPARPSTQPDISSQTPRLFRS
jgi:hypothetical protein